MPSQKFTEILMGLGTLGSNNRKTKQIKINCTCELNRKCVVKIAQYLEIEKMCKYILYIFFFFFDFDCIFALHIWIQYNAPTKYIKYFFSLLDFQKKKSSLVKNYIIY